MLALSAMRRSFGGFLSHSFAAKVERVCPPKDTVVTERLDPNLEIGFEEIGQEFVVGLMLWNRVYISGNLYCRNPLKCEIEIFFSSYLTENTPHVLERAW